MGHGRIVFGAAFHACDCPVGMQGARHHGSCSRSIVAHQGGIIITLNDGCDAWVASQEDGEGVLKDHFGGDGGLDTRCNKDLVVAEVGVDADANAPVLGDSLVHLVAIYPRV